MHGAGGSSEVEVKVDRYMVESGIFLSLRLEANGYKFCFGRLRRMKLECIHSEIRLTKIN